MVIRVDSLSFSQILSSLTNYFNNQVEADRWRDFYESSTGRFFVRLLSAFGSFISYLNVVNRRETYLTYAENRSSLIGIAQNLGYSAIRGSNEIVELTVVPTATLIIPAYTAVGIIKDLELITVEEVQLNNAVPTTIKLYLGKLKSENLNITTNKLRFFRFISDNVSEFFRIKLNGDIVPSSRFLKDLSEDKYVALSNPLGSVDVAYFQNGSYQYENADTLTLEYIELSQVSYVQSDLQFDYGSVLNIVSITPYSEPESNDNLRVNASLFHETQVVIRGRNDYLKQLKQLGYGIVDTNGKDFTPATVLLSYVRDTYTLLNSLDITQILTGLDPIRPFGVPLPRIKTPRLVKLALDFNIRRQVNNLTELVDIANDVNTEVLPYELTLSPTIDLENLENAVEDYSYVKRVRVTVDANNRVSNTLYQLGEFINSPLLNQDKIYRVHDYIKYTAVVEPSWVYAEGVEFNDNGIIWRCIPKYSKQARKWKPNRATKIDDLVQSNSLVPQAQLYLFECVDIIRLSGSTIPTFTPIFKQFTEDNELIWVCKPLETSDPFWLASNSYRMGDSIREGDFSYEVVGYRAKTKNSLPVFKENISYPIITLTNISPYTFTVAGDKTSHFLTDDIVQVTDSTANNGYYTVVSSTFSSPNTIVTVQEPIISPIVDGNLNMEDLYTKDGEILWEIHDRSNPEFQYGWRDYLKTTSNITLS